MIERNDHLDRSILSAISTNNAISAQIWRRCTNNMDEYTRKIPKEKYCKLLTEIRLNSESNGANFATIAVPLIYCEQQSGNSQKKKQKKKYRNTRQTNKRRLAGQRISHSDKAYHAISIAWNWINEKYLSIINEVGPSTLTNWYQSQSDRISFIKV